MPVYPFCATSWTNRPSWRDGPSFSPPTDWRTAVWAGVSAVGTPSTNSRTVYGSGGVPSWASPVPMMSLLNMPWTSAPAALSCLAR
jgi:hypothetical protein